MILKKVPAENPGESNWKNNIKNRVLLQKNLGPIKLAHFVVIYIYMYCISSKRK
jgi:hypothetical protein